MTEGVTHNFNLSPISKTDSEKFFRVCFINIFIVRSFGLLPLPAFRAFRHSGQIQD